MEKTSLWLICALAWGSLGLFLWQFWPMFLSLWTRVQEVLPCC